MRRETDGEGIIRNRLGIHASGECYDITVSQPIWYMPLFPLLLYLLYSTLLYGCRRVIVRLFLRLLLPREVYFPLLLAPRLVVLDSSLLFSGFSCRFQLPPLLLVVPGGRT